MPLADPPRPRTDMASVSDVVDYLIGYVRWFADFINHIDTLNVEELDAGVINAGILNAGLVTIQSLLTAGAYIQIDGNGMKIFDGVKNTFIADITGLVTMTGALVRSSAAYPRVELNSASALLAAFTTALNYIQIVADNGGQPALFFNNGSVVTGIISPLSGANNTLSILTSNGKGNINIDSGQDLNLSAAAGKQVKVQDWNVVYSTGNTQTLLQALNGKANAFSGASGTVYVSSTSGGPATTAITFSNGIRTS